MSIDISTTVCVFWTDEKRIIETLHSGTHASSFHQQREHATLLSNLARINSTEAAEMIRVPDRQIDSTRCIFRLMKELEIPRRTFKNVPFKRLNFSKII